MFLIKKTEINPTIDDPVWNDVQLFELRDAISGGRVAFPAKAKILWSEGYLFVLFDVSDEHIWGTLKNNDDPIWQEEVIEVFLSFGRATPKEYCELQFSPNGVKYDAWVKNPTGKRGEGFDVDVSWNVDGLDFLQKIEVDGSPGKGKWVTLVKIPPAAITKDRFSEGDLLRINLFRIDGYPKQDSFQAWQPTEKNPPDFHVPEKFALIKLCK